MWRLESLLLKTWSQVEHIYQAPCITLDLHQEACEIMISIPILHTRKTVNTGLDPLSNLPKKSLSQ